jgi:endonuclease YncB( thermonuclease family)
LLTTQTAAGLTPGGQPKKGINMKIEMTKQTIVDSRDVRIGQSLETTASVGEWLVKKGWAIVPKPKPKKKAKK